MRATRWVLRRIVLARNEKILLFIIGLIILAGWWQATWKNRVTLADKNVTVAWQALQSAYMNRLQVLVGFGQHVGRYSPEEKRVLALLEEAYEAGIHFPAQEEIFGLPAVCAAFFTAQQHVGALLLKMDTHPSLDHVAPAVVQQFRLRLQEANQRIYYAVRALDREIANYNVAFEGWGPHFVNVFYRYPLKRNCISEK